MAKLRVGIAGGSGYGGAELLRILLFHPFAEVAFVAAGERAGSRIDEVYPHFRGLTDLAFSPLTQLDGRDDLDCLFLALPHGRSLELVPRLPRHQRLIDLSGDFRLADSDAFLRYYGQPHGAMQAQADFVYGLAEANREAVQNARRIANPGCFATAALLGLQPLVERGALNGKAVVSAITGSSGSGSKPASNTHHPVRSNSFYAYKPFSHQHLPEVVQSLQRANPEWSGELVFQTHSAPLVRGIFASIYCSLQRAMSNDEIREVFAQRYRDCFFIRLAEGSPDVNWVKNSNFADIGWAVNGSDLIVFVAIDNLVKGAAGQAVQNMNLMFALPEEAGLTWPGGCP